MKPYNTHHIPLSLDGRGPKPVPVPDTGARVKNDAPASSRHCGLDPQSRGAGQGGTGETRQHQHPSRHCGLDPPVHRDENDKAFTPLR